MDAGAQQGQVELILFGDRIVGRFFLREQVGQDGADTRAMEFVCDGIKSCIVAAARRMDAKHESLTVGWNRNLGCQLNFAYRDRFSESL